MSKVVLAKSVSSNARKPDGAAVVEKRVRGADGRAVTLRTIEGGSATFGDDLTYVFAKNVAKARRENKQVTGATDRVPAKG